MVITTSYPGKFFCDQIAADAAFNVGRSAWIANGRPTNLEGIVGPVANTMGFSWFPTDWCDGPYCGPICSVLVPRMSQDCLTLGALGATAKGLHFVLGKDFEGSKNVTVAVEARIAGTGTAFDWGMWNLVLDGTDHEYDMLIEGGPLGADIIYTVWARQNVGGGNGASIPGWPTTLPAGHFTVSDVVLEMAAVPVSGFNYDRTRHPQYNALEPTYFEDIAPEHPVALTSTVFTTLCSAVFTADTPRRLHGHNTLSIQPPASTSTIETVTLLDGHPMNGPWGYTTLNTPVDYPKQWQVDVNAGGHRIEFLARLAGGSSVPAVSGVLAAFSEDIPPASGGHPRPATH